MGLTGKIPNPLKRVNFFNFHSTLSTFTKLQSSSLSLLSTKQKWTTGWKGRVKINAKIIFHFSHCCCSAFFFFIAMVRSAPEGEYSSKKKWSKIDQISPQWTPKRGRVKIAFKVNLTHSWSLSYHDECAPLKQTVWEESRGARARQILCLSAIFYRRPAPHSNSRVGFVQDDTEEVNEKWFGI